MVETLNNQIRILLKYSAHHALYSMVGGYFLLSIISYAYFKVDIGIPCLFRLATGLRCPGCGITHAFAHIAQLEFSEAWNENKLSFIVLPAGLFYLIKDYFSFHKKYQQNTIK